MPRARLLVALLAGALGLPLLGGDVPRPLPAKHTQAKVVCQDCHKKENPSKSAVADESCMLCHGDYAAMVDYTKHLKPNPHNPPAGKHPAQAPCTECHRQHVPPVVKCLECHPDFTLKAR